MARLKKEEYLESLKKLIGDDTSEEAIKILEDFTDTYDELETSSTDTEDWKDKFTQNDAEWRKKYKDRFFSAGSKEEEIEEEIDDDTDEPEITINDLFSETEK